MSYSETVEIDKNHPVKHKSGRKGAHIKWWQFSAMEVGDSFFVAEDYRPRDYFMPIVRSWNKRLCPKKFVTSKFEKDGRVCRKDGKTGIRVQRIA